MKAPTMITLLAAGMLLGACQKPAPAYTAQDETAIRAVFDSTVAAVRAGNFDAWAGLFASDARFYPANSPTLVGRAAIVAWGKSLPPMESFSFADVAVAGEGNLAYGSSRVLLRFKGLPADTSKQLVVMRRDSTGHWFVQAVAVSTDLPLPPPPAAPPKKGK